MAPDTAGFPPGFLAADTSVAGAWDLAPRAGRRGAAIDSAAESVDFTVEAAEGEAAVVAVRHASGALTFHAAVTTTEPAARRGGRGASAGVRRLGFRIRPGSAGGDGVRRGAVAGAVRVFVLKVVGRALDAALPVLARRVEQAIWRRAGRREGWLRVTREGLRAGGLPACEPPAGTGRALLLLHGTFSHAASAFRDLAEGDFFARVTAIYGDRIHAFDHFSVSRSPEENARALWESLPAGGGPRFDVITHSRGGLVLRNLVERAAVFGGPADRFRLGRAVLVASPNEGTALATPDRWRETFGWFANLMELFPDNPFSSGAGFVAAGISWLGRTASGRLPGLAAMDGRGADIAALNLPPGPPAGAYAFLVANHEPAGNVLARLLDTGADAFFSGANDLVVPTEGGWRIAGADAAGVDVACFGPGGNLGAASPGGVHHVNFFAQPEAREYLARVLEGAASRLPAVDTDRPLPLRARRGGGARGEGAGMDGRREAAGEVFEAARASRAAGPEARGAAGGEGWGRDDTLRLMVLDPFRELERPAGAAFAKQARLIATFGSARATARFPTGGAGSRWHKLIAFQKDLRAHVDGAWAAGRTPLGEADLVEAGIHFFETLFPGDVRRLYDEARARNQGRRLNVVFASEIAWVAELPWEFAHDPARRTFLATEEIHFVRSALTAVPAERMIPHPAPLRLLVAVAQPIGTVALSAEEETGRIKRAFQALEDAGVVKIDVLAKASPSALHDRLEAERFDVLHFVGHGEFDEIAGRGQLLFEDGRGGTQRVNERQLCQIVGGRGLRLVFLNACETGTGGAADFNRGVAPGLMAAGVPAVVANQFKVLDAAATTFAQRFYWSLARGLTLGEAARESRISVGYSDSEAIDWAVPVLYASEPEARLCPPGSELATRARGLPVATRSTRRAAKGRAVRIAIWDVTHAFPALVEAVDRMNAAQTVFGFELVALSVPSGTWELHAMEGGLYPYLNTERVLPPLTRRLAELRRDMLVCLTDLPLTDGETLDLFVAGDDEDRVALISTAGFELAATGREPTRFFTNNLVAILTVQRSHVKPSQTGAKRCPLYYNTERDLSILVGRQRFDARRRRMIAAKIPAEELAALEVLLALFDGDPA